MVIMTYQIYYYWTICILCILLYGQADAYGYGRYQDREYYHTVRNYGCLVEGRPSAFKLAERIATGNVKNHAYDIILESNGFRTQDIDATILAYALYTISERIGDRRAKDQKAWLERYMDEDTIDRVMSVIYRKYARSYLESCFSINGALPLLSVNDIYPLYMD